MNRAFGCFAIASLLVACADEGPTFVLTDGGVADTTAGDAGLADGSSDDADAGAPEDVDLQDTDPADATPADVDPADADPADADPADADPADADPADADPADADPADTTVDTTPDVPLDTAADTRPDTAPDATPDVAPDVAPDVTPDVAPDVTPDAGPFVCGEDVTFAGQVFRAPDEPPYSSNGGTPTSTPYPSFYDAGIETALAAGPTDDSRVPVSLPIVSATVTATSFNTSEDVRRGQTQFWISDGVASMQMFLPRDESLSPPFLVTVGQRISFTVTELGAYQGVPQVTGAADWVLETNDNPVYIRDLFGPLSLADVGSIVRVTGTLAAGSPCGGSATCYPLTPSTGGAPVTLRSSSLFLAPGDCVTYVGPVFVFADVLQLDTINFDWLLDYTANDLP